MTRVLTANGELKDALADFLPFIPQVALMKSGVQAIPNTTQTNVTWDTEETDTDGMHDLVTNTDRITFNTPGLYIITLNVQWASAVGVLRQIGVLKNGASWLDLVTQPPVGGGNVTQQSITVQALMAKGDYVVGALYQDSGAALNVVGGASGTKMQATYVGPGFSAVRAKPTVQYVTPAQFAALAPIDGDEVYLIVDAVAGTTWHFRYSAGSASAYKWEFLGGASIEANVAAAVVGAGAGIWGSDVAAQITVPRAGDYVASYSGQFANQVAAQNTVNLGIDVSTVASPGSMVVGTTLIASGSAGSSARRLFAGLAAANILRGWWQPGGTGNVNASARALSVLPVRIS